VGAADVVTIVVILALIPTLVENYLGRFGFSKELRMFIMFGGMLWVAASCASVAIYALMGLYSTDGNFYNTWAYTIIIPDLQAKNYSKVFRLLLSPGSWFYTTYQGFFYYFTGGTVISMHVINGFMAFWGGLTLTRLVYSSSSLPVSRTSVLPFFLIFIPSVFFWSSSNLKEGLMYWAICQVFAFVAPSKSNRKFWCSFLWFLGGTFVGAALRPHIILFWIGSVLLVKAFQREFWKGSTVFILLLLLPLFIGQVKHRIPSFSIELMQQGGERLMNKYIERAKASTFEYGKLGPIPVLHGPVNTLFRPFPWRTRNLRSIVAGLEIWSISLGILFVWIRRTNFELRHILANPAIWVAILVCIPFIWFFTYTVNEGVVARQRVQLFPALLVLFAIPLLMRRYQSRISQRSKGKPM